MSDKDKSYSDQQYAERKPAEQSSVEDIPAKDAAEDESVKGGRYWRPVMLPAKPEEV